MKKSMKTFEEVIHYVCLAKIHDSKRTKEVQEIQTKRVSLIREVCESWEAHALAELLIHQATDISIEELFQILLNAIAQGVLIGMEMEKIQPEDFPSKEE